VSAPLTVTASHFVGCHASSQGGAGYISQTNATITTSLFRDNTCEGRSLRSDCSAAMQPQTSFAVPPNSGGCISGLKSTLTIDASLFEHNVADREGGVVSLGSSTFRLPRMCCGAAMGRVTSALVSRNDANGLNTRSNTHFSWRHLPLAGTRYRARTAESSHSVYSRNYAAGSGAVAMFNGARDISFDHDAINSSQSRRSGRCSTNAARLDETASTTCCAAPEPSTKSAARFASAQLCLVTTMASKAQPCGCGRLLRGSTTATSWLRSVRMLTRRLTF